MISVLYSQTVKTVLITVYWGVRCQRKSCRPMTSKNLPWHGLTAQLFSEFLLITQQEVPFINTSEVTKRSSNRTENGKCTNVTNRRGRVGLSTPIYTNHRYNFKTPDLFWWVFSLSRIFTDLIMHYCWSNQSALVTRCGTDFRHQYGIFGGESQTSFKRNATRAGSEEGRRISNKSLERLKCHCDEISHFFFPLFFAQNNLPSCTMSFRPERKN